MTGPAMPTNMTNPALAASMDKTMSSDMTSMEMPGMCLVDNLNFATVFMILINAIANSRPKNMGRVPQFQAMDDTYDFIVVGGGTAGCVVANRYDTVYTSTGHKLNGTQYTNTGHKLNDSTRTRGTNLMTVHEPGAQT
ncbi:hypothetical protein Cfor_11453 [Coptotermes formosanus]|uniref:Glucose-methanol-choline oxidoreductase N-terminal domain-containing protein n=1 Tax=Coptotermes formosanus TaxID=36987 RepID=A0A6L2PYV8_COPFO|nr:hypothetical protein Cfor_11453 [Coptotermes formosanus]